MTIKVHAIQTGTVRIKQAQRVGKGADSQRLINLLLDKGWTPALPIYCWLIEHPEGLVLVDTGETARTTESGYFPRWHPFYWNVRMDVTMEDEIGPQLRQRGFDPNDVRYVVLTHMHTDHAGGLHHFPEADFLVSRTEYQAAQGFGGRIAGYLPQHWPDWFTPTIIDFAPQPLLAFQQSYRLLENIYLLPTPGHSNGHLSVYVDIEPRPIFIAGDVSYTDAHLHEQVLDGVSPDAQQQRETLRRTLESVTQSNAIYLPSHDPDAVDRLAASREKICYNE